MPRTRPGFFERFAWMWGGLFALLAVPSSPAAAPGPCPTPIARFDGPVRALATYGGRLVAGGSFANVGAVRARNLAAWDGGRWTAFPDLNGPVYALVEFGGDLVVGGAFTMAGTTPVQHIARWNGSSFAPLGSGTDGPVRAFVVQAGVLLYAGGSFTTAGGVEAHSVARFIGSTWSAVGNGLAGDVNALTFYGPNLVAAGDFSSRDGSIWDRNVAIYSGGRWLPLANGIDGAVHAAVEFEGGLTIGGDFNQADWVTPARHVARLVGFGENWSSVGYGFGSGDSLDTETVHSLYVDGTKLVAGGTFTRADTHAVNRVARLEVRGWGPLGIGMDASVRALVRYDGLLYAGGEFTSAGGSPAAAIAVFDDVEWGPVVPVPVGIADWTVEAAPERARLTWRLSPQALAAAVAVAVQRAPAAEGPYRDLTSLVPAAVMSFDDTGVAPGDRFGYRLVLHAQDGTATLSETRFVTVPGDGRAAARLHAPYASAGTYVLGYDLAAATDVHLDIYDVTGRLVRAVDSGWRSAGSHVGVWDRLDARGRPASYGVYVLHLRTGTGAATRKLVVAAP